MNRCDECKHKDSCVCVPYGCECFEFDLEKHDKQIRADAITECLQIVQKIKDDYNDARFGKQIPINYGTICGIIIEIERLKEQK